MNIQILQLIDGAKKAKGITVIIDVFRAFSVEAYVMNNNAETIIPVAEIETARRLKAENEDYILIGERNGIKLDGFDFGNSPTAVKNINFTGKTVVHTTSAGTQGVANAINADEILTGALVNAEAIARYIKLKNPNDVSLVCMGLRAVEPTDEDTLCAEYIKSLLEDNPIADMDNEIEKLKPAEGSKFFDPARSKDFPETDFYLSTDLNKFNFVLKVERGTDNLCRVKKIDV